MDGNDNVRLHPSMLESWYKTSEAAELLGTTRRTLQRRASQGDLETKKWEKHTVYRLRDTQWVRERLEQKAGTNKPASGASDCDTKCDIKCDTVRHQVRHEPMSQDVALDVALGESPAELAQMMSHRVALGPMSQDVALLRHQVRHVRHERDQALELLEEEKGRTRELTLELERVRVELQRVWWRSWLVWLFGAVKRLAERMERRSGEH